MLFPIAPLAFITATIGPEKLSVTVFFVVLIGSSVFAAIFPGEDSIADHLVVFPVADVPATVAPSVGAFPMDVIILERS